jgi:gamma-glutamylcyclotransferase (GGCT)/AIG2-like uncharacterized protein YtfP
VVRRFFFYGTLRRGQSNHHLVSGAVESVVPATTAGRIYHLPAGYPALTDGDGVVHGDLVTFAAGGLRELVARLDDLEGVVEGAPEKSLYLRELRWTRTARGRARAWCYVFPAERLAGGAGELVEGGDWVKSRQGR